jgi:chromosome segregation ATPase
MNDKVQEFCENVHSKLESLEGRMDSLKLNIGTTWHSLQEKLKEVRQHHEASRQPLADARSSLEKWFDKNNAETKTTIDRDTQQLAARAQKAEECAWTAIRIAEASIDDAERMILEAIAAKLDAEAVAKV